MKVIRTKEFDAKSPAEQASIIAEVERLTRAHEQLGPDASCEELLALYNDLRTEWDGELVYVLPENIA